MSAIECNGSTKVTLHIGALNCIGEPYVLDVGGCKMILRFHQSARKDDFGKMTFEKVIN